VLAFNSNGAAITDTHGVNADFSAATQYDLALDVNAAIVTNVTASPLDGEASSGQLVKLTLAMSEAVTVNTSGGSPTLFLSDGAIATYDAAASKPSAGTLVFDYTVGTTDITPDLQVTQVHLNGATINDASGNAADLSAASNFSTNLQIGPLFVNSVTASQLGGIRTGQTTQLTIAMSGDVTILPTGSAPTLTLNDQALATYDFANSNPSAGLLVFDYTVRGRDQTPNLEITSVNPNGDTIRDANGVSANFANGLLSPTGLTINSPLVVQSVTTSQTGQSAQFTLRMSEGYLIDTSQGSPTLALSDGTTANYDSNDSNPSSGMLVFEDVLPANEQASDLQITALNLNGALIQDSAGNNPDCSTNYINTPPPDDLLGRHRDRQCRR
jgi:hypothetical protein